MHKCGHECLCLGCGSLFIKAKEQVLKTTSESGQWDTLRSITEV